MRLMSSDGSCLDTVLLPSSCDSFVFHWAEPGVLCVQDDDLEESFLASAARRDEQAVAQQDFQVCLCQNLRCQAAHERLHFNLSVTMIPGMPAPLLACMSIWALLDKDSCSVPCGDF